ncbi:Hypothetical predicted protein [Pelobates cultripes]|uniref:Uncharacterized protein n=1 Tax=Pelobates cultripes TaxID=61616 RepID=A0AAD1SKI6_PELCU|nr:Hypothetical predicted protein [Pelobates cultripes]
MEEEKRLASETVESAALAFERVHHVHGGDRLPLGVLGVGDGIADNILQEDFEHSASLLVNEAGDSLDASSASQTADSRFSDPLDVIPEHLPVPLGTSFTEPFPSFTATRHPAMRQLEQ